MYLAREMPATNNNYRNLKQFTREQGADLFGVADIAGEYEKFSEEIRSHARQFPYAVVAAVKLSSTVLDTIEERPNEIYKTHYRTANSLLDQIAFRLSRRIDEMGYKSMPIAASFIVDWKKQVAHVSHKDLAILAGIGWWGRNNLVVNPGFGPAIRLVSVLTDLPLSVDTPLDFGCGSCSGCLDFCPAGAITEDVEDFDHIACYDKLREFSRYKSFGQLICGICIKNCPLTDG